MEEYREEYAAFRAYLVSRGNMQPPTVQEASAVMGVSEEEGRARIESWEEQGLVMVSKKNRVAFPGHWGMAAGKVQRTSKGFAFLMPVDEDGEECYIAPEDLGGALHEDLVLCSAGQEAPEGRKRSASVVRILKRGRTRVVGTYEEDEYGGFVSPDDERYGVEIAVPEHASLGAKPGEKVMVEITVFPETEEDAPEGIVSEILGAPGEKGVDVLAVIRRRDLPDTFPEDVLREADEVCRASETEDLSARRDLRNWHIVTIDGIETKDLDDAVSLETLPGGGWRLGVHIADVSERVREGGRLEAEAYARGTSVYLLDRVLPMLPPALSNGICSLNYGEDRACLSCVMELNAEAEITSFEIFESLIRSSGRLVYDTVDAALAGEEAALAEYAPHMELLREMQAMTGIRQALRTRRGNLSLDIPEPIITLDENGFAVDVRPASEGPSHQMIEECMLCANETVAEWMSRDHYPVMYRVHESPDPEKMRDFSTFVTNFGMRNPQLAGGVTPIRLQKVLEWFEGKPQAPIVHRILLRSLAKARYESEDRGHFGLAAEHYCHFTSPIRRYPDLNVHRCVKKRLHGEATPEWLRKQAAGIDAAAAHATEREILSIAAEREVDDIKMAEYMTRHIGEEYDGMVAGITEFGMFIELENSVEGMVHISTLEDDFYNYDPKTMTLLGRSKRKLYRVGDRLHVKVTEADPSQGRIGFELAGADRPIPRQRRR